MPSIVFGEHTFSCQTDEPLLDTLLKNNQVVPYGCRQGVCQSCMMRSLDQSPPVTAQAGIKDSLRAQNYFLACICYPEQDMTVALSNQSTTSISVRVVEKQRLAPDIMRLTVSHEQPFNFFAGQFVNLQRADGLTRSYSIANPPHPDQVLEFHIRRLPNGQFSNWVYHELEIGETVTLSEAQGSCIYVPGNPERPLLLIGTGTGLAPLAGIIKDALRNNHSGPIHLFHGSRDVDGLYLVSEMRELAAAIENFYYTPCLSGEQPENTVDGVQGRVHDIALKTVPSLKGWQVYLCGHPEMVKQTQIKAYLKGASIQDIYADAFLVSSSLTTDNAL